MTLLPLTTCCHSLGVDAKTLRLWLKAAQLSCSSSPFDARLKCLTLQQLERIATLHHRPLSTLPPEPAPQAVPIAVGPLTSQDPSVTPIGSLEACMSQQLSQLQQQVATLQAQVSELALALLALHSSHSQLSSTVPVASAAAPEPPDQLAAPPTAAASPLVDPTPPPTVSARPRSRALPLLQVRADGSVVVIAPTEGVLPLLPDSKEWFAWLSSIEAFSFESPSGRFSATRKFKKGQRIQSWNVHCSLHGRSCTLYLGLTPALTLARLQEMAGAVHTRLTAH